ncbi:hypothetical protein B0H19DRAFT_570241 [Mycena capillaripes]|nr:hypothetical protein B0H19DRAFT_570241 [Mycena capillaripes]
MYMIRKPTTGGSKAFSALPPKSIIRIGDAARARFGVELPPVELKEVEQLAVEEAAIPEHTCLVCIARRVDCVPIGYGLACLGCAAQKQSTCDHKFTAEQLMNIYSEISDQVPYSQLKDTFREAQVAVKSAAQACELADSLSLIANERLETLVGLGQRLANSLGSEAFLRAFEFDATAAPFMIEHFNALAKKATDFAAKKAEQDVDTASKESLPLSDEDEASNATNDQKDDDEEDDEDDQDKAGSDASDYE